MTVFCYLTGSLLASLVKKETSQKRKEAKNETGMRFLWNVDEGRWKSRDSLANCSRLLLRLLQEGYVSHRL